VRPCSVTWLWLWRLGLGKLALLEGDPDLGKSWVALDLSARLSTGRPMPDGSPGLGPAPVNVLLFNGEDSHADTICPRLLALGADLDHVFVQDGAGADLNERLSLPSQVQTLDVLMSQCRPRLLVLDPVVSFLDSSVNLNSDRSVRRALRPLALLAARYDGAVLLIYHLKKRGGDQALYRGLGSIAFTAACRSAWLVGADPEQPGRHILAQVKNNLAPPQPSLAFRLDGQPAQTPSLLWLGPSALSCNQLLAGHRRAAARDDASRFLAAFLAQGPRSSREVWTAAQEQGLSERTLKRAKRRLGLRSQKASRDGVTQWYCLLPSQKLAADPEPPSQTPNLDAYLAELERKHPPATPLDDDDLDA
jgi:hypothetical protein